MTLLKNPAIPVGSLLVVTGANGFMGCHVTDVFLQEGYKVRGVVRDAEKSAWVEAHFQGAYGKESYELYVAEDLGVPGAWAAAMEGASAVIHSGGDVSWRPDPEAVITPEVASLELAATAATNSPTVKRLVLTSSYAAADWPREDIDYSVGPWAWNEKASKIAWDPDYQGGDKSLAVYSATKATAERTMFDYVKHNKPGFVFNSVLPDSTFGPPFRQGQGMTSSPGGLMAFFHGVQESMNMMVGLVRPQYMISAKDAARLHLIAAVHPDVQGERLFGCAKTFTWNRVLQFYRQRFPDKQFAADFPGLGQYCANVEGRTRAVDLLRESFGNEKGFETFEETMAEAIKAFALGRVPPATMELC